MEGYQASLGDDMSIGRWSKTYVEAIIFAT